MFNPLTPNYSNRKLPSLDAKAFEQWRMKLCKSGIFNREQKLQSTVLEYLTAQCPLTSDTEVPMDLWMGGTRKEAVLDAVLREPTSGEIVALMQSKLHLKVNDKVVFNQSCADLIAYVQNQLKDDVDFSNLQGIQSFKFREFYKVPLVLQLESTNMTFMTTKNAAGIPGTVVKNVSLGKMSSRTVELVLLKDKGRDLFSMQSYRDMAITIACLSYHMDETLVDVESDSDLENEKTSPEDFQMYLTQNHIPKHVSNILASKGVTRSDSRLLEKDTLIQWGIEEFHAKKIIRLGK